MERVRNCFLLCFVLLLSSKYGAQGADVVDLCPVLPLWKLGEVYELGDRVLGPTLDRVFECKLPLLCGLLKYEILPPGALQNTFSQAWTQVGGLCRLPGGICPVVDWVLNKAYTVGAHVSVDVNGMTHTFNCRVANLCGLADYQPLLGRLWRNAWSDLGLCQLPGGVCPLVNWVLNKVFSVGATVEATDGNGVRHTLSCTVANLCGLADYQPLLGRLWRNAWRDLGECRLGAGVCPLTNWVLNAPYTVGSLISANVQGAIHTLQCLAGPSCGLLQNQPLLGTVSSVWRDLGDCLQLGGLCPKLDWVLNTVYNVGATVSVDVDGVAHTFRCTVANLCGLADHQPLVGKLWAAAWKDLGVCQLAGGACPAMDWALGTVYSLGTLVVTEVDGVPHAVECLLPAFCGLLNYQPLLGSLWSQAWRDLGECGLPGGVCAKLNWVLNKVYTLGATISVEVNGEQHTFVCTVASLCGLADRQPLIGTLWRTAWRDLGECKLPGGLCPLAGWVLKTVYNVGATVNVEVGGERHTLVCKVANLCGLADYQPLVGTLWRNAWADLGECELAAGLCGTAEWALNKVYKIGESVVAEVGGEVHTLTCRLPALCGLALYEPFLGGLTGLWRTAWTDLGVCNNKVTLKLCPVKQWVLNTVYSVGVQVSADVNGETHTFVCMVSNLCGLAAYHPVVGALWRMAWADLGECVDLDVCPTLRWVLNTVYAIGATVQVDVNGESHTFVCRVDDLCGLANYHPLVGSLWRQAWSDLGECGSLGTAAAEMDFVLSGGMDTFSNSAAHERKFIAAGVEEAEGGAFTAAVHSAKQDSDVAPVMVVKIAVASAGAFFFAAIAMGIMIIRSRRSYPQTESTEMQPAAV